MFISRQSIFRVLNYIFFLGIGIIFLYFTFRNADFDKLTNKLREADLSLFLLIFFCTFLCHLSRAMRWNLLINPYVKEAEKKVTVGNSFLTVMLGYFVNTIIPRLGEITRCVALGKRKGISFNFLLGTVIIERVIDVLCLGILTALALLFQAGVMMDFFMNSIFLPVLNKLFSLFSGKTLFVFTGITILFFVFILLLVLYRNTLQKNVIYIKFVKFIKEVREGILSVIRMEYTGYFLLHTFFIWSMYFLMTYLWFFSYGDTSHLTVIDGISVMVVGSLARALPIQGGSMGAYHFLVSRILQLMNVSLVASQAIAVLIHLTQTLYYVLVGGVSSLILLVRFKKKKIIFK